MSGFLVITSLKQTFVKLWEQRQDRESQLSLVRKYLVDPYYYKGLKGD